ncbi:MAG: response regulator [Myxococcales bacterium]|nr:response regulator [Myxococcales bacterium]
MHDRTSAETTELATDPRIEGAFEDAPVLIAIHRGPDHRVVYVNRRWRESFGSRAPLGRALRDVFPELVELGGIRRFDDVFATGLPVADTGVRGAVPFLIGGPGEERYWNYAFQPTRRLDGTVDGITVFAFEVTELVLMRRAAELAEKRYDDLAAALNVVVWCVDAAGWRPQWVRGDASRLLGIPTSEALNPESWVRFIHPEDVAAVMAARQSVRAPGERYRVEYRHGAAETGWRWIAESAQLRAELDADGLGLWGLMQDVTERAEHQRERERLQTQLLHVQKLESLGVLAGGIAHDFNNLLTAILGNASLAEVQLEAVHPAMRSIVAMVGAARRASDLTGQLLAFSGRGHFRVQPVDLNGQLRELVVLLEASISKKVSLRIEAHPGVPMVEADLSQLNQVFMNLVINGAEATGAQGGTVLVRTGVQELGVSDLGTGAFPETEPGRFVFVEVSDTGEGMDEHTLARIFDPFFSTKVTGRGLGLAAVQGIIRGHRGVVRVHSKPGWGTTFKVFFPAAMSTIAPGVAPAAVVMRRGTVLVVDDEPAVRAFARSALEFGGYRVLEAADGSEGVETFRALAGEIDLVLLDLTMPHMNGDDALIEMRKLQPGTPVVLSSGYNEADAKRPRLGRASVPFIQKPYPVRDLLSLVGRLVKLR